MIFPTLKVIVGVPGSGKTTYCKNYIEYKNNRRTIHISSDKIRKEILNDENDQTNNNKVFEVMHQRTLEALENGYDVLYDATNITRKDRLSILNKCPSYVIKEAIVCWAPIGMCIERDINRDRTVGKDVIDRMLKRFQAPYFDEGFDRIYVEKPENWSKEYEQDYIAQTLEKDIEQDNPHHTLSLQQHMYSAYKYLVDNGVVDTDLLLAATWHDLGKLYTKTFTNTKGETTEIAHYYGHQGYSAWIVYGFKVCNNSIAWLVSTHMDLYQDNNRYVKQLPIFLKNKLELLHEADVAAH